MDKQAAEDILISSGSVPLSLLRVLIVDDQELFRRSLRFQLSSRKDWQICGETVDGIDAVDQAKSLQPDVVLIDI